VRLAEHKFQRGKRNFR